jgi:signal transduction histidine kinase
MARLRTRSADRPIDVHLAVPPVIVDPVLLDEAFTNIVENAVKHTPPGTRIRISAQPHGNGSIRLTIEDSGPGVPPDALPRLFDKFFRVPVRSRGSRSGTGIGLAVARGLIDTMGGQVSARPSELGGLAIDLDLLVAHAATDDVPVSEG